MDHSHHLPPPPPPPAAQPPVQMPFSDPFQNRDPFLPSSSAQHRRKESLGTMPGLPPPPSFGPRSMPPPSPSSSNGTPYPPHPSRGPVSTSPFASSRDSSGFATRPGGGLSIGSLIGSDSHDMSPKRARSTSMRSDIGRAPRPLSPRGVGHGAPRDDHDRSFMSRPGSHMSQNPQGFRPYQSSPSSVTGTHDSNGLPAPPRPNSQPNAVRVDQGPWAPPSDHQDHPRPGYDDVHSRQPERAPQNNPWAVHHQPDPRDESAFRQPFPGDRRSEYEDRRAADVRQMGPTSSPTPSDNTGFESRFRHYGGPSTDRERDFPRSTWAREDDAHPIPRSLLTVSPELRREGRSSPLPQAVQGAQPRMMGPARDPSIKNEFGRMFSGLGSGVGGSGTPTGPFSVRGDITPSRLSPPRFGSDANHGDGEIVDGTSMLHRDNDIDAINGRSTPTGQQKGNKRSKTTHVPHHHHHHAHAHHHHHHHHPQQEENGARGGFSTLRFPPTSTQHNHPAPAAHHHHHHVHPAHHHHHAVKAPPSPVAPEISIQSSELLAQVAHLPRSHAGTALYDSDLSLPPSKCVLVDTRLMFATTTRTLPYLEGKENCTFTIRVPRDYLISSDAENADDRVAGGLEEICKRRAVWGSEIYTDDSDVVAAAVHSGWIKGDFGDFNEDIKELFGEDAPPKDTPSDSTLATKPLHPITPPRDRDLRITILILPPLANYTASTRFNLRSRPWGADHDGMSYMIQKIEFVDEPRQSRFQERGPAAKKARLRDEQRRRREAAESLLGLLGAEKGRAVAV